jgi:hypothetical protein
LGIKLDFREKDFDINKLSYDSVEELQEKLPAGYGEIIDITDIDYKDPNFDAPHTLHNNKTRIDPSTLFGPNKPRGQMPRKTKEPYVPKQFQYIPQNTYKGFFDENFSPKNYYKC